jgi:hypothetical protein
MIDLRRCQRRLAMAVMAASMGWLLLPVAGAGAVPGPLSSLAPFGTDLQGRPLERLAPAGTREVVLFFAATDCPISNRYVPEIARLNNVFRGQGVEILSVYPNPGDTLPLLAAHEREFGAAGQTVRDTQQRLVGLTHAVMTPEAAVLVPEGAGWREVYLGRIDDRYVSLGQERPAATRHDLEDAIRAALARRPVPPPGGPAVGCGIVPLS